MAKASTRKAVHTKSKKNSKGAWSGSITFGLLDIPINLLRADRASEQIHLTLLDSHDNTPIHNMRVNSNTGKEVKWSDIVKGYEYEKGKYVVLTEEEIKAGNGELTHTIDIEDFVEGKEVDPLYFETPYYVVPGSRSSKAYTALHEAMKETGLVGIARIVLSTREHLCALMSLENIMILELMRFDHQILQLEDAAVPSTTHVKLSNQEKTMAVRLLKESATEWKPSKYQDRHHDLIKKVALQKVKTGKIATPKTRKRASSDNVVDLMSILKKSLAEKGKHRAA